MRVHYYDSFSSTPSNFDGFFQRANILGFFYSESWFRHLMEFIYTKDNAFRLYAVVEDNTERPLLVAPMRYTTADTAARGAQTLAAISHPENQAPMCFIFDESVRNHVSVMATLFHYLRTANGGESPTHFDALRLWPLDPDSELSEKIYQALSVAGYRIQGYANSFNYYEPVYGVSFEEYFSRRGSKFRYSIRRRERELTEKHAMRITLHKDDSDIERAIADYISIAKRSWKAPMSMYSNDVLALIRRTAGEGCLRLGIMYADAQPVAAQFWVVSGGLGNSCRIAYDEKYKKLAVGKVLTRHMIETILDNDDVEEIDYGYGGESYKQDWMENERHYIGFMAFNPDTGRGRWFAFKNIVGSSIKQKILSIFERLPLRRQRKDEEDS